MYWQWRQNVHLLRLLHHKSGTGEAYLFRHQAVLKPARVGNGVDPTYKSAMDWDLKEGRFITYEDVESATKICVLGDEGRHSLIRR